jgi:hypothetical protein
MLKILRSPESGIYKFFSPDTEELFYKNRSVQPLHWPYHNKIISYTTNSYGYRAPEFDTIDWAKTILVFGCSNVFGIGVDDNEHVCSKLSQHLGTSVVNMGIIGGSAMHIWALTTQLIAENINPKACVYIWPAPNRVALFESKNKYRCWGPWTTPERGNLGPWMIEGHGDVYLNLAKISVTQQWPNSVKLCHYTWNKYAIKIENEFDGPLLEWKDRGRDLMHAGPITFDNWSKIISQRL